MEQKDYRLAAIMYTDIVGFSRMMEQDEAGTLKLLTFHNKLITRITQKRNGTIIKTIGDAFLVDFRNTVDALKCAMEVQEALYDYNCQHKESPLLLRIGLHLGDIYFYENDALGEGINIAARLQSLAKPGAICFSQDVYNQVLNKLDFHAEKLGRVSLKNISKEIHAYEISSDNVEFDPDKDKPRTGLQKEAKEPDKELAVKVNPESPEDARAKFTALKETIRQKSLSLPRRLTVEEALKRYGDGSVEVQEIIAELVQEGSLTSTYVREDYAGAQNETGGTGTADGTGGAPGNASAGTGPAPKGTSSEDIAAYIGKTVEDVVRTIEVKVGEWQQSRGRSGRASERRDRHFERHFEQRSPEAPAPAEAPEMPSMETLDEKQKKRLLSVMIKEDSKDLATAKWDKDLGDSDYFRPGTEELESDFDIYREKCHDQASKAVGGFFGNIISFAAVNSLLWFLVYPRLTPGILLWPAIVTASWGIGVVSNFVSMLRKKQKANEMRKMPYLENDTLATYKKLNRSRDSMASHTATVLTVPAMLATINWVVTPQFWWSAIPGAIILLSFLGHLGAFPATVGNLKRKIFERLGVSSWKEIFTLGRSRPKRSRTGVNADYLDEAQAVKDDIVDLLAANKTLVDDEELVPVLDSYIDQIRLLTQNVSEIDDIVRTIPTENLRKDKEALLVQAQKETSPGLQKELRKSIEEIERQEHATKELVEQNEILKLRMRSSVNTLKQMKLDIIRLKTVPETQSHSALESLRTRAHELSDYVADMRSGYQESTRDPFAELERLAAEEEQKKLDTQKT